MADAGRAIANQWAQDWARGRRGGKGQTKTGQNTDRIGQKRPEWLGPRLGVSEAIEAAGRDWSVEAETRLMSALAVIPADLSYDDWYRYGMALHDWDATRGMEIFDRWSAQCGDKYPGRETIERKWVSFSRPYDGLRCTVASIYADARARGWVDPGSVSSNVNGVEAIAHVLPATLTANPIKWDDTDKHGNPKATCQNTRIALRYMGIECCYDLFHGRPYINGQELKQWQGELADSTVLAARSRVRACWRLDPATTTMRDALMMECQDHAYDPLLDYLDGLQWEGVPRVATWMTDYLGADDTPLNRMIGGLALVAAVRRARRPGAKFDHVVVLEGLEGMGKSSAVAILAGPDNFSDQEILTLNEQRQQEALQGVWLYEIAELAGMHRADVERVKAFITRTTDRTRPAYGHFRQDQARRCVFFASCNNSHYLLAQTGNRRFWPVKCQGVRMEELSRARDQLWAEACAIEARGASLALPATLWPAASEIQESRRMRDPWEDELFGLELEPREQHVKIIEQQYRIATADLVGLVLGIQRGQQTQGHYNRLGATMRLLGWEGPKTIRLHLAGDNGPTRHCKGFSKPL